MPVPPPPPLPREHGAWVMLAMPLVLGLAAGGAATLGAWLVAGSVVTVFLAHAAIVPWLQRNRDGKVSPPGYAARRGVWGALYLCAGTLLFLGAAALLPERDALLGVAGCSAVLAGAYALASVLGRGRSIAAEVTGMTGMALTAAMIGAAAGRPPAPSLFGASVLALAYSLSSLSYVRAYERLRDERGRAVAACTVAHALIVGGVAAATPAGIVGPYGGIALVPVLVRTAAGLARPPGNLRALGMRELWVAAAFAILGTAAIGHP